MLALRNKKGFTLLELVIVMVIIGILVSLALPRFVGVRRRAYRVEALTTLNELKNLAWAHNLEQGGVVGAPQWPDGWPDLGYTWAAEGDPPDTPNWTFGTTPPTWGVAGPFVMTGVGRAGTPAEGTANAIVTLFDDGTSDVD